MLTIAKSPLRVSFFGGGTDYPDYFQEFPGAVLGTAIDKFIYTVTLPMAGVAETKYRITYRNVETVDNVCEIKHNVIRAVLQDKQYDAPMNIAIISDLPGGSGLGSSSSFTVGFVKLISHLQGRSITKLDLMREAVRVETELLHENCGIQDQSHASFGGLNHYRFHGNDFSLQPVRMTTDCRDAVNASMCLIYTGVQRSASKTLETQISNTRERKIVKELRHLYELCEEGVRILEGNDSQRALTDLGKLISEGWMTKRSLSPAVSSARIDDIYKTAMSLGGYGGKLCGAGGGGFMLFLASDHVQAKLRERFGDKNFVKISTEDNGASIVHSFA
ncbi:MULTISPECIES: hypothetical protein [unclassified Rhizobium]|uniref:GHMP family kinase ATP-binding protein n=1 Tax=unclassified Rhizobium TaxID=2613769 RepID=UPI00247A9B69|nr:MULTISPECIES: hypothetical protein [unclassified Rhizobium]MDH7804211.1 D-glycero-alpha-D-manno-heptose-7-phosphate kinase [Rhizobium sp. AN70]